jgi:predicted metal-binding membrane protein
MAYVSNDISDMDTTSEMNDSMGMSVMKPDTPMPWAMGDWISMYVMWTVMMIPSASPMILLFSRVNKQKRIDGKLCVGTFIFVLGYVVIWSVFSLCATLVNYFLHSNSLMSGMMGQSDSLLLAGCLLIAVGIFQWMPWKNACLSKCRTPMGS